MIGARKYLRCAQCNKTHTMCAALGGMAALGPIARVIFVRTGPSKDDPGAGNYRYETAPWVCYRDAATDRWRAY